jgi:hypothetical protein
MDLRLSNRGRGRAPNRAQMTPSRLTLRRGQTCNKIASVEDNFDDPIARETAGSHRRRRSCSCMHDRRRVRLTSYLGVVFGGLSPALSFLGPVLDGELGLVDIVEESVLGAAAALWSDDAGGEL